MNLNTSPSQNNSNLPNQSFLKWLRSQIDVLIGNTLGLMSTGYLIFALAYYSAPKNTEGLGKYLTTNNIPIIIYWLHLIFITYCVTKLVSILDDNKVGFHRTKITYRRLFKNDPTVEMFGECKKVIKKFKLIFICFWVSMFLLYTSFLFNSKWEVEYSKDSGQSHSVTPEYPSPETVKENPEPKSGDKNNKPEPTFNPTKDYRKAFVHIASKFFVYSMNCISLMFVFWCFIVLYRPPIDEKKTPPIPPINERRIHNQKKLIGYSIIATVVLIAAFPLFFQIAADSDGNFTNDNLIGYVVFFYAISGVLNAVALALLIARLDSKLVGLPSWLVGVLYFYAAVQPLIVVFELPEVVSTTIEIFVLIAVFTLKIYFFFIILYTFQTGRLLNYILCFPTLNTKVDSIFQNQFEIYIKKDKSKYDFIITRKNSITFTTDAEFVSRNDCEKEIGLLMDSAKDRNSYGDPIQKLNGSYIVELRSRDSPNQLYCTSTDMKSKEEAEELIEESIEKLPYCKFDYNKPSG